MGDYGRIQALVIATMPGHVVYERFYSTFTDLERAEMRAALQVGVTAPLHTHKMRPIIPDRAGVQLEIRCGMHVGSQMQRLTCARGAASAFVRA